MNIEKELEVQVYNTSPVIAEYYGVTLYIEKKFN